jgi:hypothetical protein
MSTKKTAEIIAVSLQEFCEFGCPYCGFRSGYTHVSAGGAAAWSCGAGDCGKTCCVLAEGITKSPMGINDIYPELQDHPRRGTPKHGVPDKKPKGGGEFFHSRGVGFDHTPGCFVCGGEKKLYNNIAAFVQCKESGERVAAMFKQGAWLDFRAYEPDYVQVKVGACKKHLPNLQKLHDLTKEDVVITDARIKEACS